MERRNFIRVGLMAASGVALAGCSEDDGNGDDTNGNGESDSEVPTCDIPAYSAWPPDEPRTNDFVLFGHLNIQHFHEADGEEDEEEPAMTEDDEDVLFTLPGYGFITTAFWFQLGLWGYPWEGVLGSENEPEGMATEALTMTEGTFIFHGEYNTETFADEYADGFEEREANGFTAFEGQAGGNTEEHAYATVSTSPHSSSAPSACSSPTPAS